MIRLNILPVEFQSKITKATTAPVGASGTLLDVVGQVQIPVRIGSHQSEQVFTVVNTLTVDCLLGVDYLTANEVIIDYKHSHVTIRGHIIPFTLKNGIATTIQLCNNAVASSLKTTIIPGRSIQLLDVQLPDGVAQHNFSSVLIEPLDSSRLPQHVVAARTLSAIPSSKCAVIQVMNISPGAVTIYKGTKVGNITPLSDLLAVDNEYLDHPPPPTSDLPNIDLTKSGLSADQQQKLSTLLHQYKDVFATDEQPLGRTSTVKHNIYTEGPPIRQPVRRQPVALQDTIDREVEKMLQQEVIQESFSPWSSPVVMVKKKDGTWRFCVDYRKLNDATHHDAYPLPRIDVTLDSLAGSILFTTLDLASGYWQVEVNPEHKEKTAFSTS